MTRGKGKTPGYGNLDKHIKSVEHKERVQPASRKHLGHLEKKKDYVNRSARRKAKVARLKQIKRAVSMKNPDEYNIKMTEKVMDMATGKMRKKDKRTRADRLMEQLKQNKSNVDYLNQRVESDRRRVEELLGEVNGLSGTAKNSHTLFIDSDDEETDIQKVNPTKLLNTTADMLKVPALRGNLDVMAKQPISAPDEVFSADATILMRVAKGELLEYDAAPASVVAVSDDEAAADEDAASTETSPYDRDALNKLNLSQLKAVVERTSPTGRLMEAPRTPALERLLNRARLAERREAKDNNLEATRIVAKKYRELSERQKRQKTLKQLVGRVEKRNGAINNVLHEKQNAKFKKGVPVRKR